MLISFVIPIFNEELRVQKAIDSLNQYLPGKNFQSEVIFVDDGSTDKTIEKIKRANIKFNYHLLSYQPNQGKGHAVKVGALKALGNYILLMDVDMSTPIEEFDKFLPKLSQKSVIIGTRKGKTSLIKKRQPYFRQKLGEIYTLLAQILIVGGVSDFTCGFKCFPKSALKVFELSQINRWSYDPEILFLASKLGFEIKEIPVVWINDERTRVKILGDSIKSFIELIKIRLDYLRGKYNLLK